MKNTLVALCAIAFTPLAFAQSDCSTVKQDKARLACYDKAAKEKAAAPTPSPASSSVVATTPAAEVPIKPGDKINFKAGVWHVHQELDAMTDKKSCTALYRNDWKIQGTATAMYLGFKGRGGVKFYTLRYDDQPAESQQSATKMEKDISAVIIDSSNSFDRIYNGKRLRAQVGTILGALIVEDIDLTGFKEAVDYIRANCAK